ncbi:glycosyltransferase [Pseudonocardia nematodicida]|uniref:Glycosyltransferase n=1 Tax=Pseudonocardia nematodicida TaxID=1206997 RepID=A0ABV1K3L7_9PSEU
MNHTLSALVVVITYRSGDVAADLAATVSRWLAGGPDRAAVFLDNSDDHECVATARAAVDPSVIDRFVAEVAPNNLGFSFGVNHAVELGRRRWGEPRVVLLHNPDVATSAQVLERVVMLAVEPGIGIAAPTLRAPDGAVDRGSARRVWNKRRLFATLVGLPALPPLLGTPRRSIPVEGPGVHDVAFTSGAYMAIRREVFGTGLDTRLPMYLEDQEICHRAHDLGYRVVVSGDLSAEHVGGVSRKSNTAQRRALRLMELVVAPCLSLMDTSGIGERPLKMLVGAAGLTRGALALPASLGQRGERAAWLRDQLTLAAWFVSWAMTPGRIGDVEWNRATRPAEAG